MQIGQGVGRASRDIKIHRQKAVQTLAYFRTAPEGPPRQGTTTHGDDHLGVGYGFVGLKQGCFHVPGYGTGHDDAVCMAGRSHEVDSKAGQVKKGCCQDIEICFAGVAAAGRYLAQLQRAAKKFFEMLPGMCGQFRK